MLNFFRQSLLNIPRWQWAAWLFAWSLWLLPLSAHAATLPDGQWYRQTQQLAQVSPAALASSGFPQVTRPAATGGEFWFSSGFDVQQAGWYVLDFKNSSVIGSFTHYVYNANHDLVAQRTGGILSGAANPFFLRHGRDVWLEAGHYELLTQVAAPFFLAIPDPYVDSLLHYRQAIKAGNTLTLVCLGVLAALGIYYAALSLVRGRKTERLYALFILGNLLYNLTALLVLSDVFGAHWFYLISFPILFSNICYVLFVSALLEIAADATPHLYRAKQACIAVLIGFAVVGVLHPAWSLELCRYGVGMFLLFGFSAGVASVRRGHAAARLYLLANVAFLLPGLFAISVAQLSESNAFYVEHIGLFAVTIEVIMLAFVLAQQFGQLLQEREHALLRTADALRLAMTDALTGLPNRHALDKSLAALPNHGALTFVDLDGLKHYNDHFGHQRGNVLLRTFGINLAERLGERATVHRIGGDEFAITCEQGDTTYVTDALLATVQQLQLSGFEFVGASAGTAFVVEARDFAHLEELADARMYQQKSQRRQSA